MKYGEKEMKSSIKELEEPIKFKFEPILCKKCGNFEDTGLRTLFFSNKKGHVKGKFQVRFYCHSYREYMSKLYSRCLKYID
jgi:histidinol phosphatase-like enzyme